MKTQKLSLLGNIGETLVFDKLDQQIFNSQQRRETYVNELRRDGVILPIQEQYVEQILNNIHV